ncbi:hypothetical protein C8F04DRAFT_1257663 [Mycena alexandri]|uniref:Uncharacterized protein n=1 Tax=Mycena alexandri TaxID=1745969 RepID=A0AAD6T2N7_9AGAR|nr:hypothetical protein C8F04DRAFT_1257663 [Mycena alexandri]
MHIFFAVLCTYGGLAQGVAWFDALLGRAVSAADGVYLTFNLPLEFAEPAVSQGGQETPSYSQEKLLGKTLEREDSSSSSPSSAQVTGRPGRLRREVGGRSSLA